VSKRRKQHRADDAAPKKSKVRDVYMSRPFAGLPNEGDWVAMRELLPAATAPLRLKPEYAEQVAGRHVTLATVLPLAWPAMSRTDGQIFVAMQRQFQSGDLSRDVAASLLAALSAQAGKPVAVPSRPGPGPRMQDLLTDGPLEVTLHDTFDFWLADDADTDNPQVRGSMERANASIYPTQALDAAASAYWCQTPEHAHVRVVLGEAEDTALNALARLRAAGELKLVPESKFAGMFRAHGLLVPVWDLPQQTTAKECEAPVADFITRYTAALTATAPLDSAARRARDGLVGRQLTLR
jgi:hypothetical protein